MKRITNIIIVDASGSMESMKEEVRGGLKQTFFEIKADMKKYKKDAKIRTVVVDFSSAGDIRTLVDTTSEKDLTDEIANSYLTRSATALYDAIGSTFNKLIKTKNAFVTIFTDGMENDSKEFDGEAVSKLIAQQKTKNKWAITFVGSNETAISNNRKMKVSASNVMRAKSYSGAMGQSASSMMAGSTGTVNVARAAYTSAVASNTLDSIDLDNVLKED